MEISSKRNALKHLILSIIHASLDTCRLSKNKRVEVEKQIEYQVDFAIWGDKDESDDD
jgi:hypothetical protein